MSTSSTACADCTPSASRANTLPPTTTSSDDAALDTSLYVPPVVTQELPCVVIEFCDRCRWLHRATWTQTELFLTFPPPTAASSAPGLRAITLLPRNAPETGGRFRVWLLRDGYEARKAEQRRKGKERWNGWELVWDRKVEGRFPEMKELKQRIRDLIAPALSLGHSDKPSSHSTSTTSSSHASGPTSSSPQTAPVVPTLPITTSDAKATQEEGKEDGEEEEEDPPFPGAAAATDGRQPGQLLASDFAPSFRCG
ncbi:hypothetical protein JCM11251_002652 [Rhodosporidiobolus azoricus]